jgi:hypothetical protein
MQGRNWEMKALYGSAVAALLLLGACSSAQDKMADAGKQPMTAEQVRASVVDKTYYGTTDRGIDWAMYRSAEGEMRGRSTWDGGSETDIGSWWVNDDGSYCAKWTNWQGGREGCWFIYDNGETLTFARLSGRAQDNEFDKVNIASGNPENL